MGYLEEGALRFIDVTNNPDLTIELLSNGQPITDSKDEKVKKPNKHAAKRKVRLNNLYTLVWAPAAGFATLSLSYPAFVSYLRSSASLLSRLGSPTPLLSRLVPALALRPMPALLSLIHALATRSPTCLLLLPAPISYLETSTALSSHFVPAPVF